MRRGRRYISKATQTLLPAAIIMPLLLLCGCNVHEWPEAADTVSLHLRLNYATEMTEWYHLCDETTVEEQGEGNSYDNTLSRGRMRSIIRAFPTATKQRTAQTCTAEYVITRDLSEGYDHSLTIDLPAGSYDIMIWSDLTADGDDLPYHNADNFAEITLQEPHAGSTNYRDAFRGRSQAILSADYKERLPDTLDIAMERPLAKFEFITNDVVEFIKKEAVRIASKANAAKGSLEVPEAPSRAIDIADYKVVFYYIGFMPNAYSIHADTHVDCSTGVFFESTLKKLSEREATMGYDYVFVNGKTSAVTVQIGIYDSEGEQLSLTAPIEVPLKRNRHTLMSGMFLMSKTSGGVTINPDYDGDHNLIIP